MTTVNDLIRENNIDINSLINHADTKYLMFSDILTNLNDISKMLDPKYYFTRIDINEKSNQITELTAKANELALNVALFNHCVKTSEDLDFEEILVHFLTGKVCPLIDNSLDAVYEHINKDIINITLRNLISMCETLYEYAYLTPSAKMKLLATKNILTGKIKLATTVRIKPNNCFYPI